MRALAAAGNAERERKLDGESTPYLAVFMGTTGQKKGGGGEWRRGVMAPTNTVLCPAHSVSGTG
jgi:hypothetical protein